jgi:hypothetical protein
MPTKSRQSRDQRERWMYLSKRTPVIPKRIEGSAFRSDYQNSGTSLR